MKPELVGGAAIIASPWLRRMRAATPVRRAFRVALALLAAAPLLSFPLIVAGQNVGEPMAVLDPAFDRKKAVEIARLRRQIGEQTRIAAAQARAKKRNSAALAASRRKIEDLRNAVTDLAVDYVAQMEMAEALVRLEVGEQLAERYRKDLSDTLWRLGQRANAGNVRAQATLGTLYRLGIVAGRSEERACGYYRRAAEKGHVAAMFHASECVKGKGGQTMLTAGEKGGLTPFSRSSADPKPDAAKRLLDRAAEGGHPVAQEMFGRECLGERPNAECAITWIGRAAAQGRASAMSLLGWIYSTGHLGRRDERRALSYFLDAAKLGDAAAQNNAGQMFETGRGTQASGEEAFAWYQRAAEGGLGAAQVNLARCYIEARGTARDLAKARAWLELARKQGVPEAGKLLEWLDAGETATGKPGG